MVRLLRCSFGDHEVPVENFCESNRPRGYQAFCRDCSNRYRRERHASHPEVREQRNRSALAWRIKNKTRYDRLIIKNNLKRDFGITIEQYDLMVAEQKNVCLICSKPERSKMRLAVDHDHKTGKIRGLLCSACNNGLGCFYDNQEVMQKAIQYLKESIECQPV